MGFSVTKYHNLGRFLFLDSLSGLFKGTLLSIPCNTRNIVSEINLMRSYLSTSRFPTHTSRVPRVFLFLSLLLLFLYLFFFFLHPFDRLYRSEHCSKFRKENIMYRSEYRFFLGTSNHRYLNKEKNSPKSFLFICFVQIRRLFTEYTE